MIKGYLVESRNSGGRRIRKRVQVNERRRGLEVMSNRSRVGGGKLSREWGLII